MGGAGYYAGKHYTEWVDTVKDLKRAGDLDATDALLRHLVDAVESESAVKGWSPPPWYYEQLAIIARKRKDYDAEIAILERHDRLSLNFGDEVGFATRLRKARDLKEAAASKVGGVPRAAATATGSTRERMLRRANRIGISDRTLIDREREYARDADFTSRDAFWSLANDRVIALSSTGQWALVASVYREMAQTLVEEQRDWLTLARLGAESSLRAMSPYTNPDEVMVVVGCRCTECAPRTEVRFQDALENPPIPHADCADPPCACWLMNKRHADWSGARKPADEV